MLKFRSYKLLQWARVLTWSLLPGNFVTLGKFTLYFKCIVTKERKGEAIRTCLVHPHGFVVSSHKRGGLQVVRSKVSTSGKHRHAEGGGHCCFKKHSSGQASLWGWSHRRVTWEQRLQQNKEVRGKPDPDMEGLIGHGEDAGFSPHEEKSHWGVIAKK